MTQFGNKALSRREQQIMDIVYRLGKATVNDVLSQLPESETDHEGKVKLRPSYSTVRALMTRMEMKRLLRIEDRNREPYVYLPVTETENAAMAAFKRLAQVFFGGSMSKTVLTLVNEDEIELSDEELERIVQKIEERRRRDQ